MKGPRNELNTYDVRCAALSDFSTVNSHDFDEWLESHDAEVRNEAIIARDTRTPADLIQAAWEAAYPTTGRMIPARTPHIRHHLYGAMTYEASGTLGDIPGGENVRTLEPLPPLIPEGTPAVWASTKGCDVRRVLVLSEEPTGDILRYWRDGDGDEYADADLIDPVPIPEEGER
ncbi:hypothetical protein [Acidipropionibacterium acidipropionici]|uniref:hypothetical protein n=1 Tax=Acidipropionibacterium acidipropionici TaxID=1748 RepID=UPI00110B57E9|nr:hypothetical protein [Acidipropionibacterium acidipropionici]QCV95655.1 hypothetical protein FEZ30_10675 [Acidipropionibacterium acidipropionici]